MKVTIHQPNFFPYLGYFDKAMDADLFVFMDDFQYTKRSYINRNRIKTPEGWMWLTVPVKSSTDLNINQVEIVDNSWRDKHLTTLNHMYGKSTYYDQIIEYVKNLYNQSWDTIAEVNIQSLRDIFAMLEIDIPTRLTSDLDIHSATTTGRIIDICEQVGADEYISGSTGKEYLEVEQFDEAGLRLSFHQFSAFEYSQRFGDFVPNLSILDYLMNEGPKRWK